MEITITTNSTAMLVTTHRGYELEWQTTSLWKLGAASTSAIYGPLNEYWQSLNLNTQDATFGLYEEAYRIIESDMDFDTVHEKLKDITAALFDLIDYNYLESWVAQYGHVAYNDDIKPYYTGDYPERQTYLKDEYDALVVISFYFKMITPIWGKLSHRGKHVDKAYKDMVMFELLANSKVHNIPAMHRLRDYCEALTEKDPKKLTPAICLHMGTSEIPTYFLAVVIVRRIAIGEIRDPERTLIKIAYKFIESRTKNLSNGVRDKRVGKDDSGKKDAVASRYRISQAVPDAAVVAMSVYINDVPRFVKDLNPEGSVEKAQGYANILKRSPRFSIGYYHKIIAGIVCRDVIYPRTFMLIRERDTLLTVIAETAAWLSDIGMQHIANLMLASKSMPDEDDIDGYTLGGLAINPLLKEHKVALEAHYPFQQQDAQGKSLGNPAITTIDEIVKELNQYDWQDSNAVPPTLRNDLATILIKTLTV